MKLRTLLLLFALLLTPFAALAQTVPDDVIHDALLTLAWDDDGGEYWTEGHIVLDEEATATGVDAHVYAYLSNYGFMDGVFTCSGGGQIGPVTLHFDHNGGSYTLRAISQPEDGENYERSIQAMFSSEAYAKLGTAAVDRNELVRQQHVQAQAYLDSIARTESIQDWRERDLQLANMLVHASNRLTCFSPPYPLWVTSQERMEDGVSYVYTRTWTPDADAVEGHVYHTAKGDMQASGLPGTQVLTKQRRSDGAVVETITIHAGLNEMTVSMADDGGVRTYHFVYDGLTFHRPTVTETGCCGVSYPLFDQYNALLPE